jgi:membrane protein required for colicin V production
MEQLNGLDVLLIALVGVLALLGVMKGLTRLLIGIGTLIAALVLATQFHETAAETLVGWIPLSEPALRLIAYVMVFLGTMVAGGVVAMMMRRLLKVAMLTWADRLAGAAVGLAAAMLMAALLILPLVAYAPFGEQVLRDSRLAPYVTVVADLANQLVPDGLSEEYRAKVESLRRYWRERWAEASARAV